MGMHTNTSVEATDLCPPPPNEPILCDRRNCRENEEGQCQRFWRHELDETDIMPNGQCRFARIDDSRCEECGDDLKIEVDRVECWTCQ